MIKTFNRNFPDGSKRSETEPLSPFSRTNCFPHQRQTQYLSVLRKFSNRKSQMDAIQNHSEISFEKLKAKVSEYCSRPETRTKRHSCPWRKSQTQKKISLEMSEDLDIQRQAVVRRVSQPSPKYSKSYLRQSAMMITKKKRGDKMGEYLPTCKTMNLLKSQIALSNEEQELQGETEESMKRMKPRKMNNLKGKGQSIILKKKKKKILQNPEKEEQKLKGWQVRKSSFEQIESIFH